MEIIEYLETKDIYFYNGNYFTAKLSGELRLSVNCQIYQDTNRAIFIKMKYKNKNHYIKIYYVGSIQWGYAYFGLSTRDKYIINNCIILNKLPYKISPYGVFINNLVNLEVQTIENLKWCLLVKTDAKH